MAIDPEHHSLSVCRCLPRIPLCLVLFPIVHLTYALCGPQTPWQLVCVSSNNCVQAGSCRKSSQDVTPCLQNIGTMSQKSAPQYLPPCLWKIDRALPLFSTGTPVAAVNALKTSRWTGHPFGH
eukprot:3470604-Amphidinium_carterae.1